VRWLCGWARRVRESPIEKTKISICAIKTVFLVFRRWHTPHVAKTASPYSHGVLIAICEARGSTIATMWSMVIHRPTKCPCVLKLFLLLFGFQIASTVASLIITTRSFLNRNAESIRLSLVANSILVVQAALPTLLIRMSPIAKLMTSANSIALKSTYGQYDTGAVVVAPKSPDIYPKYALLPTPVTIYGRNEYLESLQSL